MVGGLSRILREHRASYLTCIHAYMRIAALHFRLNYKEWEVCKSQVLQIDKLLLAGRQREFIQIGHLSFYMLTEKN